MSICCNGVTACWSPASGPSPASRLPTQTSSRSSQVRARVTMALAACVCLPAAPVVAADAKVEQVVSKGLDGLAGRQSRRGNWAANEGRYPTPMTALAGTALLMEGSTTTQGRYAEPVRQAVD
ncbi:MAG: hypothetical protein ACKONH_07245, partial [Planctomycetia bacterium]